MAELELRELRYFVAVAEELDFVRAAERLSIEQPPLLQAVRQLEHKLEIQLFDRSPRQVTLTAAGRVLLERARLALDAAEAAAERTRRAGAATPELVVAAKPGSHGGLLRDTMDRYAQSGTHPQAMVHVGGWGDPADMIRAGRADVALLRSYFDPTGLDFEPLLTEPRAVVLPASHPLADSPSLLRADLLGDPVTVCPHASVEHARYRAAIDHLPEADLPQGPTVGNVQQTLEAVAAGRAIAFLALSDARRHGVGELTYAEVTDATPSIVAVAWPAQTRSLDTAAFVDAAVRASAAAFLA